MQVPKGGRFRGGRNEGGTQSELRLWSFPIVPHEKDGSGGNLTSLNYNLESNKYLPPEMCNRLGIV